MEDIYFVISQKAGILLFILNFIGLLVMNGSAEYLSLVVRNWSLYRVQGDGWQSKYNQFWKCMPFKLVMPFETEFLYVQNQKCKADLKIDIIHWEHHLTDINFKILVKALHISFKKVFRSANRSFGAHITAHRIIYVCDFFDYRKLWLLSESSKE